MSYSLDKHDNVFHPFLMQLWLGCYDLPLYLCWLKNAVDWLTHSASCSDGLCSIVTPNTGHTDGGFSLLYSSVCGNCRQRNINWNVFALTHQIHSCCTFNGFQFLFYENIWCGMMDESHRNTWRFPSVFLESYTVYIRTSWFLKGSNHNFSFSLRNQSSCRGILVILMLWHWLCICKVNSSGTFL